MDVKTILSKCDHTLLAQTATWQDIKAICDDGMKYQTASVCIPPCYVKKAKEYVGDKLAICTVIGFPNGYNTTAVKEFETKDALANGADEIDMVINIGALKAGDDEYVLNEIKTLKKACGNKILKVIIETCLLTDEEKIKMCRIVTEAESCRRLASTQGGISLSLDILPERNGTACRNRLVGRFVAIDDGHATVVRLIDGLELCIREEGIQGFFYVDRINREIQAHILDG